ncbi:RNA recognition motif-containing protein [Malassezia sp. CBS 17886]|nr:RNA recognition motif-containing protein [Malassezia sp. CBS 17886]
MVPHVRDAQIKGPRRGTPPPEGGGDAAHGNTLFVTRLPYTVTNTDLATFFSDIGPLRRAFVVTDRETRQPKGVGYVTYSDVADATRALETLQGASVDGSKRHIQLTWADRKPADRTAAERPSSADHTAPPTRASGEKRPRTVSSNGRMGRNPDAVRTVVLSGLARCSPLPDVKQIYKRARKLGDVEEVTYATVNGQPSADVAYVRFRTPNHAMAAVPKLHAHQFKGAQLSAEIQKRIEGAARREQHMRTDTREKLHKKQAKIAQTSGRPFSGPLGAINRDSRVIVRNLPFDMTVDDLRAVFLPYGAIYDVTLPMTGDGDEPAAVASRGRGFAFVWFVSRSDAERAIQAVNGVSLRHGAAEQAALKKAQGKKGRSAAKEALQLVHEHSQPARPVAVDWSLGQKEWQARAGEGAEETRAGDENGEQDAGGRDDAGDDKDRPARAKRARSAEVEDASDEEREEGLGSAPAHDEGSAGDEGGEETGPDREHDNDSTKTTPAPHAAMASPDTGTILFIRNLPYQATEQELKDLFRTFGPLRYARIAMDPTTKRSRGTGFVCFWSRESADKALHDADVVQRETTAPSLLEARLPKVNPFSVPSVLSADPSAPLVAQFTLHGRVLHVVRAVTRESATKLETTARKSREKEDKRNTWLLREGVPLPNTPLAGQLSEKESDKRMQSFSVRRAQLGANPSLHVSKTRLAVHQLPLFATDKTLKRLALHALRAFTDEVKAGTRADLDEDEKADNTQSANAKTPTPTPGRSRPPPSLVVQSKVVTQAARIDPLTGKGRSRGYGFLEMRTFPHALKVLRWTNANKAVNPLLMQWWREELEAQLAKLNAQRDSAGAGSEADARRKRLETAIAELGDRSAASEYRGIPRVEFSIENVTTVRKRVLRQEQARDNAQRKRRRLDEEGADEVPKRSSVREAPADSSGRGKPRGFPPRGGKRASTGRSGDAHVQSRANRKVLTASRGDRGVVGPLIGKKRRERKLRHS